MILADTSVRVDHLRRRDARLAGLRVVAQPVVLTDSATLWTRDRRLPQVAESMGGAHLESSH